MLGISQGQFSIKSTSHTSHTKTMLGKSAGSKLQLYRMRYTSSSFAQNNRRPRSIYELAEWKGSKIILLSIPNSYLKITEEL